MLQFACSQTITNDIVCAIDNEESGQLRMSVNLPAKQLGMAEPLDR